jgi:hypothetical protein
MNIPPPTHVHNDCTRIYIDYISHSVETPLFLCFTSKPQTLDFKLPKHPEINSINVYNIDFHKLSFDEFQYLLSKELQLRYKPQIFYYQRILAEYLILEDMNDLAEPISLRIFEPDQSMSFLILYLLQSMFCLTTYHFQKSSLYVVINLNPTKK